MSRNGYIRQQHDISNGQIDQQQEELEMLELVLHCGGPEFPILPVINEMKERRQIRLGHNKRHKADRAKPTRG